MIKEFSYAIDSEKQDIAKQLYEKLLKMVHPDSRERKIMDLDMEMIEVDDKA